MIPPGFLSTKMTCFVHGNTTKPWGNDPGFLWWSMRFKKKKKTFNVLTGVSSLSSSQSDYFIQSRANYKVCFLTYNTLLDKKITLREQAVRLTFSGLVSQHSVSRLWRQQNWTSSGLPSAGRMPLESFFAIWSWCSPSAGLRPVSSSYSIIP